MQLWEFLIWFPAVLAALMAIPMYFIGKILYDRKAGILAAAFFVFDTAIISRTLGGDPDSDGIVLILPLIIIVLFLYTYKTAEEGLKKKTIIFSLLDKDSLISNFWIVVKTIPPPATFKRLFRCSRFSACTGSWRNSCLQLAKVSNSWSSRSFLSVRTTIVGLWRLNTIFPA